MQESCHVYEGVMDTIHIDEGVMDTFHSDERVMSHVYEGVMSHTRKIHTTQATL